ncbi:MAG: type IIL restriction-modification enzyme MmeI [Acidobacteriota bacterium]|nr:type IIL restriction-modification enzyme MmeI [Acidobacteriota bacterium]
MAEHTVEQFIERWQQATGTERANYQLFLTELCELLELPRPEPSTDEREDNSYVFERRVNFAHADGTESRGFIDLYRRGCFVLEAKQTGKKMDSASWGTAMLRAHGQAQQYARALHSDEGRPPFLVVTDVGRSLELYSEFSRSGATYVPFPDPRSYRVGLEDLAREEVREQLRAVWLDPMSLDPSRRSARVTKAIATNLAKLASSLEKAGHGPDLVAAFLMRCLFTMFAEDVGLLPARSFTHLLEETRHDPDLFPRLVPGLWRAMNEGGFSAEIRSDVLRFNGGLFAEQTAVPLDREQVDLLLEAARADWRDVEPAIFGTLLERALNPRERHRLGAHYTPRAYVERLVMPTVIEPLREDWSNVQAAALTLQAQGREKDAAREVRLFHRQLCKVRVLDPACGSGNFLYVTLEHMKRLEGEVFNFLAEMGDTQAPLEMDQASVDPHQMLGLETNPRAARIAEAVLWIGYLQWHFRTRGNANPPEPVLRDFHNIENRDAVLAWDSIELERDETGAPVTRWDGVTTKTHPVTGEQVPDETATVAVERYVNPRKAEWPEADFVVGNPPFIGKLNIRASLGDGYVDALRAVWPALPHSADYVMYWWHYAAKLLQQESLRRFGLITTNSIAHGFNRRVLEEFLTASPPISLVFAIPDHPWVDESGSAAVRIAMTVGTLGPRAGELHHVVGGGVADLEGLTGVTHGKKGVIGANLRQGADVTGASALQANSRLSATGVIPHGKGMVLTKSEAESLGLNTRPGAVKHIRRYLNGRDLTQHSRDLMVIDLFPLAIEEVQRRFPELFQWISLKVKPQRDQNRDKSLRENWWLHRRNNEELRNSLEGLPRYIATVLTSRQRIFYAVDGEVLPDQTLVAIGLKDLASFCVLSSRQHVLWSLASGSFLGVGNDSRYTKTKCFETFPFPLLEAPERNLLRELGNRTLEHRSERLALYPNLTMTGLYNVLEKLRAGEELTPKEKKIHEQGLVSVLAQIHDELDAAVLEAYGWSDLAPALVGKPGGTTPSQHKSPEQLEAEEELLQRLVDLNAKRAAEEANGLIRWLRPEFQNPEGTTGDQQSLASETTAAKPTAAKGAKRAWPKALPEQVQAVRSALTEQPAPVTSEQLARLFRRAQTRRVSELLDTLTALGQARATDDGRFVAA